MNELPLRYGTNPHQAPARVSVRTGDLPIEVLNGSPGYINLLDALNGWQLVRELRAALSLPAATSFKHVSPAGAAVAVPLGEPLAKACFVDDLELSPLASAYARSRGADRVSSYGDWAALSDPCDLQTARLLAREVSDGVIAPGFDPDALDLLKAKQKGSYRVVRIDPAYDPPAVETREVFGITFEQRRNDAAVTPSLLDNVVTGKKDIPENAKRDLIVALIALKYTQSNSVCYALDGQVIGVGAGQQSRIHCTRLAGDKADMWWLRQHPRVLELPFRDDLGRPGRNNAVDGFLREDLTGAELAYWEQSFVEVPRRLTSEERAEWLSRLDGVSLASDAYIPFRDNIDRAARTGVKYVAHPGGSVRDSDTAAACDEYGIAMAITGLRLFHH